MDSKFLASIFARPPCILGRQLKPFCAGHAVILSACESPWIIAGETKPDDLIFAIWVCSQSFEEAKGKLTDTDIKAEFTSWGKGVGQWDFAENAGLFTKYLEEHTKAPDRWHKKDEKAIKSPWALIIVTTLMSELKIEESKAWNMPLQQALWYFAAISESNGDTSLISEQEKERIRIAKEVAKGAIHG